MNDRRKKNFKTVIKITKNTKYTKPQKIYRIQLTEKRNNYQILPKDPRTKSSNCDDEISRISSNTRSYLFDSVNNFGSFHTVKYQKFYTKIFETISSTVFNHSGQFSMKSNQKFRLWYAALIRIQIHVCVSIPHIGPWIQPKSERAKLNKNEYNNKLQFQALQNTTKYNKFDFANVFVEHFSMLQPNKYKRIEKKTFSFSPLILENTLKFSTLQMEDVSNFANILFNIIGKKTKKKLECASYKMLLW